MTDDKRKAMIERLTDYGDYEDWEVHGHRIEAADQLEAYGKRIAELEAALLRFITPEPDNIACGLALAVEETLELVIGDHDVEKLRAALAARGLEIREKAA